MERDRLGRCVRPVRWNVERALKYLVVTQQSDGDFGGGMSAHGLARVFSSSVSCELKLTAE